MKKIGIVIVNYHGWRDTLECLESLKRVADPSFSIYVVDNGSRDESMQQLSNIQYQISNIKLLANDSNLGFAGGNNIGIKNAIEDGVDYILLLNNDTIVPADFLTKLLEAAESDARIGIVGPKIYFWGSDKVTEGISDSVNGKNNSENNIYLNRSVTQQIWFGGGKLNWLRTRGSHVDYEKIEDYVDIPDTRYQIRDTDYITGCCLLIKREVIQEVGLMPEDYFLYYEDVDWCLKARQRGWRVVYVPAAHIWHKVSRSTGAGSASYVYYHVRNGMALSWRFGGLVRRTALLGFVGWTAAKQVIKLCIPSKKAWAKAALKGCGDFLRWRMDRYT
ncbi:MAG: glycosyltransferase family 2 protein [bacterium]|nr:glycosyltransferase family 2 protein [bacterium]